MLIHVEPNEACYPKHEVNWG